MLKATEKPPGKKARAPLSVVPVAQPEADRVRVWLEDRIAQSQSAAITEVVTITPALAQLLLSRNESNRNVSEINLDRIKRDLVNNRFVLNGEAIIVSREGLLNDGQHRLRAVAETGVPMRSVMVFGVERETRMTTDMGNGRTVGHFLHMKGHGDARALASVAGYAWQYKQHGRLGTHGLAVATKSEALLMVDHYSDMADSLEYVSRPGTGAVASRAVLAFCHWAISLRARSGVDAFFDSLITGANLSPGDPILYCRNRLISMKGGSGRHNLHERAELIFRAWNAHRLDERTDRIVISGRKFPELER